MNTTQYAVKIERKLIQEFKDNFFKKVGYKPIVLTKIADEENDGYIKLISLDLLKELFEPFLPFKQRKQITLERHIRIREMVELRFIYCFIARRMNYSFVSIAKSLNRDHTTIMYSCDKFTDLSETDPSFREKYLMILNHIKQETNREDYELSNMEHM